MTDVNKYRNLSRYRNQESAKNNIPLSDARAAHNNLNYQTAQYSRDTQNKYTYKHVKKNKRSKRRKNILRTAIIVVVLALLGLGAWKFWPIQVKANGQEITLSYDKSVKEASKQINATVKPGNFVAVDYSVISEGDGYEYYAEVDGEEVQDTYQLSAGDELTYSDGKDKMEDYTSQDSDIAAKSTIVGVGAIHKFEGTGEPGTWSILHGKISGKYAERQTKDPDDVVCRQVNINPGKDKVIALTFDDGPSDEYTQDILDLLKKYNAHATFFTVGERLEESWGKKLVAKEAQAGHQVCTHTYDHARPAGGLDITNMSASKQIEEVKKGMEMIHKATGEEVSDVVRLPGGNLSAITVRLIAPFVSCEIGWNIDSNDWQMPGSDVILKNLKLAASGDVILCHDGGGDRSETVEALGQFLKDYSAKGYRFITIDELLQYDEAEQKADATASTSKYAGTYN